MTTSVNILVVDDHESERKALRAILSSPDYEVIEAASGEEALKCLLNQDFAVLLLDVVMPGLNGLELASLIKQRERMAHVPIIFLTAEATDLTAIYKGYRAQAIDYIIKPAIPEVLRTKVAVFAHLYRQHVQLLAQGERLLDAERRAGEERLTDLRLNAARRYRSLADAVPYVLWTTDAKGVVDFFNLRWFEETGLTAEASAGSFLQPIHDDDREALATAWHAALTTGTPLLTQCRLRQKASDTYRWQVCRAVAERGPHDEILSWIGTFSDIDDLKRSEEERERLYQEALGAIRTRDEFLSLASHELRTPLSSLQLQLEGMLDVPENAVAMSPEVREQRLKMSLRQVDRLTRLIDELLDVSRINAGRLRLEYEEIDLATIVRDVVKRFAVDAEKARSSITLRADTPIVGRFDPLRIDQVVTNLVSNALKYGAHKPIEITLDRDGTRVHLSVCDHGIGIPSEELTKIFERFERSSLSGQYRGLGLGLYIVKQIVQAHGGDIRVESRPGEGSTFHVDLA